MQKIKLSQISRNKYQPRKEFDPEHLAELAASIKENGLLQPIIVTPKDGGYELVAGERRWRAITSLGWEDVQAIIIDDPEVDLEVLSLIENTQREQLTPIEKANFIAKLFDKYESVNKVAKLVGMNHGHIRTNLNIANEKSEKVRKAIEEGILSPTMHRNINRLEDQADKEALVNKLAKKPMTRDAVQDLVSFVQGKGIHPAVRQALVSEPNVTIDHAKELASLPVEKVEEAVKQIVECHQSVDQTHDMVFLMNNPLGSNEKNIKGETIQDYMIEFFKTINKTIDYLDPQVIPYLTEVDKKHVNALFRELKGKITGFEEQLTTSTTIRRIK